jgi:hypothetical protein
MDEVRKTLTPEQKKKALNVIRRTFEGPEQDRNEE